jgi:GNAT superfamily N-acetyltransferase
LLSATVNAVARTTEHTLADPGTLMATTHRVGDGLAVRLRLARPTDAPRVRDFLEGLSLETRHRRFLAAMPLVPEAIVRHFTFFDPRRRMVVAATAMVGSREEILGLADVALREERSPAAGRAEERTRQSGVAELAVVVDDDRQGQGVGKLLTEVIAALAMQHGATHLRAELLEHNAAMLALMQRLGRTVRTAEHGTTLVHTRLPASRRRRHAA